jgi:hypothetical protein
MAAISELEIERRLNCSAENTLEALGREVYQPPLGAFPPSPSEYIAAAKRWLADSRKSICVACTNNIIIKDYMAGNRSYKVAQIVAILTDLISLVKKLPIAGACWASIALIQLGIEQFCAGCNAEDDAQSPQPVEGTPEK